MFHALFLIFSSVLLAVGPAAAQQQPAKPQTPAAGQPGEVLVDRIVAVVDGSPILWSDVQQKVNFGPLVVVSEFPATEDAPQYDRALQDAINFELILQKARELEIDVRDEEVESEIKSFLESRGLPREGLLEHLAQQGMTYEDYRDDFKDQMILRHFQGRVIKPQVKITDKDVETYFLKKMGGGTSNDAVELVLRQILFSVSATAAPEVIEAKKKAAEDVHKRLVDGMGFQEAVKIHSDDVAARASGGLMAPLKLKDLSGSIRTAVEPLDSGQFSAPVRTALGFHIFYLEEKKLASNNAFASQKKQLELELLTVELQNQTRRWLSEQRQKSKVEIVAN